MRGPVAGSVLFFLVGPGLEAGVGPWLLTGFTPGEGPLDALAPRVLGGVLVAAGLAVLVHTFAQLAVEGAGTPSPVAPTERLVVRGAYRHVRHPMYVATAAVIAGEGLLLARPVLLAAAAAYVVALAVWARVAEERDLRRRFGATYDAYRRAVPGWVPRLRPWRPPAGPR